MYWISFCLCLITLTVYGNNVDNSISEEMKKCLDILPEKECDLRYPEISIKQTRDMEKCLDVLPEKDCQLRYHEISIKGSGDKEHVPNRKYEKCNAASYVTCHDFCLLSSENACNDLKAEVRGLAQRLIHPINVKNRLQLTSLHHKAGQTVATMSLGWNAWDAVTHLTKLPQDNQLPKLLHRIAENASIRLDKSIEDLLFFKNLHSLAQNGKLDHMWQILSSSFVQRRKNKKIYDDSPQSILNLLKQRFIGQSQVLNPISNFIEDELIGYQLEDGPYVFIFAGPPGTGKTYLTQLIADALGRKRIVIDMGNYKDANDIDNFVGAREGLVGEGHLVRDLF